ncbi:cation:proton antiporter [Arsenicicoccus cauae]|uniref:Sodium:proton antiporter n=1 Tax=Arsenicicoccus cauae TaxID=2663847 RepID=A0A6I3I9N5_9MICO|nr:cation:proton antiporter [Arsenicicoccus cauae]MTB70888.1 sodium:proton antiporter [Arsenicicoccus cauae]
MVTGVVYLVAGVGLLLGAFLPRLLRERAVSAPMVVLLVGIAAGWFLPGDEPIAPVFQQAITQHVAEVCVLVSLMGVGLAIDRPFAWRAWWPTWRLLGIAMPLTIAAVALLGWWVLALSPAAAILLGAVLAPTDPVLASDVQVAGPSVSGGEESPEEEDDEVRFALTSEAGLNDALAFPFVWLALYLATEGPIAGWGWHWVGMELVGKIVIGALVGLASGWVFGKLVFHAHWDTLRLADVGEPLLGLALVATVYGLAEVLHGYGFLAVFVCAVALRAAERGHEYHGRLHDAIEHVESVLTLLILLLLGASLSSGQLSALSWEGMLVGVALVLVIRPLCGWLSLVGTRQLGAREKVVTAVFGVRGIGSVFYMAFATAQHQWPEQRTLWATVTFAIVLSVMVHGVLATPAMKALEERRGAQQPV